MPRHEENTQEPDDIQREELVQQQEEAVDEDPVFEEENVMGPLLQQQEQQPQQHQQPQQQYHVQALDDFIHAQVFQPQPHQHIPSILALQQLMHNSDERVELQCENANPTNGQNKAHAFENACALFCPLVVNTLFPNACVKWRSLVEDCQRVPFALKIIMILLQTFTAARCRCDSCRNGRNLQEKYFTKQWVCPGLWFLPSCGRLLSLERQRESLTSERTIFCPLCQKVKDVSKTFTGKAIVTSVRVAYIPIQCVLFCFGLVISVLVWVPEVLVIAYVFLSVAFMVSAVTLFGAVVVLAKPPLTLFLSYFLVVLRRTKHVLLFYVTSFS